MIFYKKSTFKNEIKEVLAGFLIIFGVAFVLAIGNIIFDYLF